jgi:hypothetical protein
LDDREEKREEADSKLTTRLDIRKKLYDFERDNWGPALIVKI